MNFTSFIRRWRTERKAKAPPVRVPDTVRCPRCDEQVTIWHGYPHICKGISAERIREIIREELSRAAPDRRGAGPG